MAVYLAISSSCCYYLLAVFIEKPLMMTFVCYASFVTNSRIQTSTKLQNGVLRDNTAIITRLKCFTKITFFLAFHCWVKLFCSILDGFLPSAWM